MTRKTGLRQWITPFLILLIGGLTIGGIYYYRTGWKKDHILVQLKPIQTSRGWGYDILTDGHIFIHQDFIPAIPGQHGFQTKEDAIRVGEIICDRLSKGQMPMVTSKEVYDLRILPDSLQNKSKTSMNK